MRTYTEERAGELKTIDIAKKLHTKMKFNQQNSSLDYRRNVDLLQKCTLISSLYVVRISMGRFDKILEANHQQVKEKTLIIIDNHINQKSLTHALKNQLISGSEIFQQQKDAKGRFLINFPQLALF